MKRRDFLLAGSALALGGCKLTLEQGLKGECRFDANLLTDPIVRDAWMGLRADRVWDVHTHLFGNGRTGGGIWVEPDYDRPKSIGARVRHTFFMNGGCVGPNEDVMDEEMIARLKRIVDDFPAGAKYMLLAFDFTYDETGRKREDLTTFCVPNAYARKVAQSEPERFEWIASVHPYRLDAIAELETVRAAGARAIKWLPPTMGIDMRSPKTLAFYDAMKRLDMPLLVHVGEEQAVPGAKLHDLGNPLFMRVPLDRGVRVIAAHCATLGESPDLDANPNPDKAREVSNFDIFVRLMGERRYEKLLFGDISAVTQVNRAGWIPRLLPLANGWGGRLLNGSDYPLPGILPIFSMNAMVAAGVLDDKVVPALRRLREVNALAFDFCLKRNLRIGTARFPDSAFETRDFFHV